jgi:hypothetical protein
MSNRPPPVRRRSIEPGQRLTIEPHKTETGRLEQVIVDADGHLILITNERVTLEKLSATRPHLIEMAEAAFARWGDEFAGPPDEFMRP